MCTPTAEKNKKKRAVNTKDCVRETKGLKKRNERRIKPVKRVKGHKHQQQGDIKRKRMMKWGWGDRLADTLGALFLENFSSGMKTIICVCWLWMRTSALLCLLHLVLLTAATIHHYLVADAPNHSILPLICLNTSLLQSSIVHPGMYCVYPSSGVRPFMWLLV